MSLSKKTKKYNYFNKFNVIVDENQHVTHISFNSICRFLKKPRWVENIENMKYNTLRLIQFSTNEMPEWYMKPYQVNDLLKKIQEENPKSASKYEDFRIWVNRIPVNDYTSPAEIDPREIHFIFFLLHVERME